MTFVFMKKQGFIVLFSHEIKQYCINQRRTKNQVISNVIVFKIAQCPALFRHPLTTWPGLVMLSNRSCKIVAFKH